MARGPGEQLVAVDPGRVGEGTRRHHELVGAGTVDELDEPVDHGGGITDDVRHCCFFHHRPLGF
jgi:hypothetical protein